MERNHFDISNNKISQNYIPKGNGFGNKSFPDRNRMEHGQNVATMFLAAKEADSRNVAEMNITTPRKGFFLKIQNQEGQILALDKLDGRKNMGHLVNVRESGDTRNKNVEAVIYLKEDKQDWLEKKAEDYIHKETPKGNPQNKDLIESIESITNATIDDFWMGDKAEMPHEQGKRWIEVWFFSEDKIDKDEDHINQLKALLEDLSVEFKGNVLSFPERLVFTVLADKTCMLKIMAASAEVMAFAPCPIVAGFIADETRKQQEEWAEMIGEEFNCPEDSGIYLCLMDSGVNADHPLLNQVINEDDCISVMDEWGGKDRRNHGTMMAGTAVYGDLADYIAGRNGSGCGYRLCSVKLLSPSLGDGDVEWAEYTQQAVAKMEILKPDKNLVFCSAVTDAKGSSDGSPTSWSAVLDKLASEEENKRLFIVSGGNQDDWRLYHSYPDSNYQATVHSPAQAWNVLTVGCYTMKDVCFAQDGIQYPVLAKRGDISPFTTTSLGWKDAKGSPYKPDIVMEGGNLYKSEDCDPIFQLNNHSDLEVISTSGNIIQKLFDSYCGTSPAAALAARFAAITSEKHPEYWPETIRGLFVQTADWTTQMVERFPNVEDRIRVFGYGVPSLERMMWSTEQGITFIAQNEIMPFESTGHDNPVFNEMHIYSLPWPKNTLLDMGEAKVRLSITLSYFVEPAPGKYDNFTTYQYASAGLRFDLSNMNESVIQLRNRISKQIDESEQGNTVRNNSLRWNIGMKRRTKGTVHKDFIELTAAELATCNHVAVYPVSGWWKTRKNLMRSEKSLRYSLIVSLDADATECDLMSEVETLIQQQAEIQI